MKTLFIEGKADVKVKLSEKEISQMPSKVCIATTVQFIDCVGNVKAQLESAGKEVILFKGKHTNYPGQILGCEIRDVDCDCFLYIGDGLFHPHTLLFKTKKDIFVYNHFNKGMRKVTSKDIEKITKKVKANKLKFLSSSEIGIIVSTKPGQNKLKQALQLKQKLKGKNAYIFITDTIDFSQLEDFPFIECWVNTACPRVGLEDSLNLSKPIINIEEL